MQHAEELMGGLAGLKAQPGAQSTQPAHTDGKFTHYRRSKTNKAPRKRTFIANMSKYTEGLIEGLESAARGVGTDANGNKMPGGLSMTGNLLPASAAAQAAAQGAMASYLTPGSSAFAGAPAGPFDPLPWDLASLPTVGEPVVWGTKDLPTTGAAVSQQQQQWGYTDLLMGSNVAPAPAFQPLQQQQQHSGLSLHGSAPQGNDAMVAAAVEAALAVLAANSGAPPAPAPVPIYQQQQPAVPTPMGGMELPLGGPRAMSWQAAAPAAPAQPAEPKVSFDLFPELAALAGGMAAGAGVARGAATGAVSTAVPAGGPMCYSRAVVTGMPSQMQVHDTGAAFAAVAPTVAVAPQQQLPANGGRMAPAPGVVGLDLRAGGPTGAAPAAAAPPAGLQQQQQPQAASTAAMAGASTGVLLSSTSSGQVAVAAKPEERLQAQFAGLASSGPALSVGSYPSRSSMSGSMLLSPGQLVAAGPSGQYHSTSSSLSMSSAASSAAQHPTLATLLLQNGVPAQQVASMLADPAVVARLAPLVAAAAAAGLPRATSTAPPAKPGSPGSHQPAALLLGQQQRESPKQGAGRGTKRSRGVGSSSGSAAALVPGGVDAAAGELDGRHGSAHNNNHPSVTGPAAPAASLPAVPFTLPLHGVSAAGAVVPGGAGQLKVSQLVSVGAYGMVYRGRWADSDVAVKMMRAPRSGEPLTAADVLRSFRHETSLLQRLAHPNIVAVRHAQDVEPVCIVQDFASHGTLSEYVHGAVSGAAAALRPATDFERLVLRRLARRLAMTPDALIADIEARSVASAALLPAAAAGTTAANHPNHRLLRRYVVLLCLLRDVAAAFVYLSALPAEARLAGAAVPPGTLQAVVHRDVKPTNILLSTQGTALLADFGVAKVLALQQPPTPQLQAAASEPTPLVALASRQQVAPHVPLPPAASAPLPMHEQARASQGGSDSVRDVFSSWNSDTTPTDPLASWGVLPEPALKRARAHSDGHLPAAANPSFAVAPMHAPARAPAFPMAGPGAPPSFDLLPSVDMDMSWLTGLLEEEGAAPAAAAAAAAPAAAAMPGLHSASHSTEVVNAVSNSSMAASTLLPRGSTGVSSAAMAAPAAAAVAATPTAATTAPQWQVVEGGSGAGSWPVHRGTAHYAAPEDLLDTGYPLTPAADVFSLGYVMWEALGGLRPWLGAGSADVVAQARQGARLPLPDAWPRRMRGLIAGCWAANPAARPSAVQVVAELDAEIRTALSTR